MSGGEGLCAGICGWVAEQKCAQEVEVDVGVNRFAAGKSDVEVGVLQRRVRLTGRLPILSSTAPLTLAFSCEMLRLTPVRRRVGEPVEAMVDMVVDVHRRSLLS